jgi:SAM-dependent methyltransferase
MSAGHDIGTPSPWVERWASLVKPDAEVLDVACGHGRHTRYFAARGANVLAVDRDEAALAALAGAERVRIMQADLENRQWPFAGDRFDAIVVANYLHRPLFPHLTAALRPDGILLYETFMLGNERFGSPRNPHFLLRPNELFEALSARLRVVSFEQGYVARPKPALVQRICAVNNDGDYVTV